MPRNKRKQSCHGMLGLGLALSAILSGGCGSESAGPTTHAVAGKITLDGEPVAGALVTFHAQDEGQNATAFTDENGDFNALTYFDNGRQSKSGMAPGNYLVTVTKLDPAPATSPGTPPKNLLPEKYATPSKTGLRCTVQAEGPNTCNLELQAASSRIQF